MKTKLIAIFTVLLLSAGVAGIAAAEVGDVDVEENESVEVELTFTDDATDDDTVDIILEDPDGETLEDATVDAVPGGTVTEVLDPGEDYNGTVHVHTDGDTEEVEDTELTVVDTAAGGSIPLAGEEFFGLPAWVVIIVGVVALFYVSEQN